MSWKVGEMSLSMWQRQIQKMLRFKGDIRNASLTLLSDITTFYRYKAKLDNFSPAPLKGAELRQTFLFYTVNGTLPGKHESLYLIG